MYLFKVFEYSIQFNKNFISFFYYLTIVIAFICIYIYVQLGVTEYLSWS